MDINKTNDATFEINLNNSKIKRYKDEELKKLALKQKKKTKNQNCQSKIKKMESQKYYLPIYQKK